MFNELLTFNRVNLESRTHWLMCLDWSVSLYITWTWHIYTHKSEKCICVNKSLFYFIILGRFKGRFQPPNKAFYFHSYKKSKNFSSNTCCKCLAIHVISAPQQWNWACYLLPIQLAAAASLLQVPVCFAASRLVTWLSENKLYHPKPYAMLE